MNMHNLISISTGKQATVIAAEAREARRQGALVAARSTELLAKRREAAKLSSKLAGEDEHIAPRPHRAPPFLVLLAGVGVWGAGRLTTGYGNMTTALVAMCLAIGVAVSSTWTPAFYARSRLPTFLLAPTFTTVVGAVVLVEVASAVVAGVWLVLAVACARVLLDQALGSWLRARVALKLAALNAEVAVIEGELRMPRSSSAGSSPSRSLSTNGRQAPASWRE